MKHLWRCWLGFLLVFVGGEGGPCAPVAWAMPAPEVQRRPVPFQASPEIEDFARQRVRTVRGTRDRVEALVRGIYDAFDPNQHYDASLTLTAAETWRQRRGNCFSFTNVFIAAARTVGIPAFYLDATRAQGNVYRAGGQLIYSGHVVAGILIEQGMVMVVDFAQIRREQTLDYRVLSDVQAQALFLNNVGWERVKSGEDGLALIQEATRIAPELEAPWNNLAALLSQQGREEEALELLTRATSGRTYSFAPWFNLGLIYLRRGEAADAERCFEKAWLRKPDNPWLLYHLAQAYAQQGKIKRAELTWRRARHLGDG